MPARSPQGRCCRTRSGSAATTPRWSSRPLPDDRSGLIMANLAAAVPPVASPATPLGAGRPGAADAALVELGGRTVAWFQVDSPSSADPDGTTEAAVVCRALALAGEVGVPAVGLIHSVGVDPRSIEGVAAWGKVAHHAVTVSGVVPILLAVTGPCHGGLAP